MARPKSKDTEAYKKRQEIFWNNLFVFLLGLVQEKIGRPRNPLKDINFLARILHKDRLIATRWRDKITYLQVALLLYVQKNGTFYCTTCICLIYVQFLLNKTVFKYFLI